VNLKLDNPHLAIDYGLFYKYQIAATKALK